MKIDITEVVGINGASIGFRFKENIGGLELRDNTYLFDKPANFRGQVVNLNGVMNLKGHLDMEYSLKCSRCLKVVDRKIEAAISEDIVNSNIAVDMDEYIYTGNIIELDKILVDNIILNLPMKQICEKDCKGLCPTCGEDLNSKQCNCNESQIDPRMEVLKKLIKDS